MLARVAFWGTRSGTRLPGADSASSLCVYSSCFGVLDSEALDTGPSLSLTCKTLNGIVQPLLAETVVLRGGSRIARFRKRVVQAKGVEGHNVRELCVVYAEPTGESWRCSRLGEVYSDLRCIVKCCVELDTLNMCSFMKVMSDETRSHFRDECSRFWDDVPTTVRTIGIGSTQLFPFASPSDPLLSKFLESHTELEHWCVERVTEDVSRSTFELALQASKTIEFGVIVSSGACSKASLRTAESVHVHAQSKETFWRIRMPQAKDVRVFYPPSRREIEWMLQHTPVLQTLRHGLDIRSQPTSLWAIGSRSTSLQQLTVSLDPQTVEGLELTHPLDESDLPAWAVQDSTSSVLHETVHTRRLHLKTMFDALGSKENYPKLKKVRVCCSFPYAKHRDFVKAQVALLLGGPLAAASIELEVVSW
ncbi:hypothetical protein SCHPADRAFT_948318 [Schizopora paradoxa]|uniref:Uncharacterized protein n=1 Tax=Schizopora paradoxa TaxID=27342 RepID=A0A0H2RFT2_9AGAM|nr:hypothetical protein SCHPADRAFT_948318 [Schizopora paradoxa]